MPFQTPPHPLLSPDYSPALCSPKAHPPPRVLIKKSPFLFMFVQVCTGLSSSSKASRITFCLCTPFMQLLDTCPRGDTVVSGVSLPFSSW